MSYSSRGNRSSRSSRSSRQRQTSRNKRAPKSSTPQSRRGTLQRPDTGYSLRSRRVRRDYSDNPFSVLMRPRVLLFVIIVIVVIVVMVVGVTSCIRRSNESTHQTIEDTKPMNEQDQRVALGVSASMTSRFTEALDEGEALAKIAANADQYDDDRMLELALAEPSSRAFVADYPSSDKSSRPYEDEVTRGKIPTLFNWDDHWGAVTYGDGPLAVTGSGPTTLAMSYMGLTGKTDYTPTQIAQQANKNNYASGDSGSKGELFSKLASSLGLITEEISPSADTLSYSLGDNTCIAVELKAGTLTNSAHWALLVAINNDESVTVYDPSSTEVSGRSWALSTIASASTSAFAISASESALADSSRTSSSDDSSYEDEDGSSYDEGGYYTDE